MERLSRQPLDTAATEAPSAPAALPENPAALVLGLDSHGLALARALDRAGVPVYALEPHPAAPGRHSRHVRRVFTIPSYERPELLYESLVGVRHELAEHDRVSLIALSDRQTAGLATQLGRLRLLYGMAWAPSAEWVTRLQRKDALARHCWQRGLNYPKSVIVPGLGMLHPDMGLRYPLIAKPVVPLSGFKTALAEDYGDLLAQLAVHGDSFPVLLQEYVPGDDTAIYFVALVMQQGRVLRGLCGRKLASHPPGRGQTTAAETVPMDTLPELAALARQFFEGTAISGLVSLELKRDPQGAFWVIEPTVGRSDFWAGLCIEAGLNLALAEHQLACGLPVTDSPPPRPARWFDSERDPLGWWKFSGRGSLGRWTSTSWSWADWRDPLPMLSGLKRLLRRQVSGLWPLVLMLTCLPVLD